MFFSSCIQHLKSEFSKHSCLESQTCFIFIFSIHFFFFFHFHKALVTIPWHTDIAVKKNNNNNIQEILCDLHSWLLSFPNCTCTNSTILLIFLAHYIANRGSTSFQHRSPLNQHASHSPSPPYPPSQHNGRRHGRSPSLPETDANFDSMPLGFSAEDFTWQRGR